MRLKLQELEVQRERTKSSEVKTYSRDLDELNKNYAAIIKNYEIQSLQTRDKTLKAQN